MEEEEAFFAYPEVEVVVVFGLASELVAFEVVWAALADVGQVVTDFFEAEALEEVGLDLVALAAEHHEEWHLEVACVLLGLQWADHCSYVALDAVVLAYVHEVVAFVGRMVQE